MLYIFRKYYKEKNELVLGAASYAAALEVRMEFKIKCTSEKMKSSNFPLFVQ